MDKKEGVNVSTRTDGNLLSVLLGAQDAVLKKVEVRGEYDV
jgi:hypothetical protein